MHSPTNKNTHAGDACSIGRPPDDVQSVLHLRFAVSMLQDALHLFTQSSSMMPLLRESFACRDARTPAPRRPGLSLKSGRRTGGPLELLHPLLLRIGDASRGSPSPSSSSLEELVVLLLHDCSTMTGLDVLDSFRACFDICLVLIDPPTIVILHFPHL